jgi:ATP-dependent Clp protease ATP-binding subunit ClpC
MLRGLREAIDAKIVGQERARDELIDGFSIAMAGLNPAHHPITTLLFLGPTGVGKTEIAKVVGEYFYDRFKEKIQKYEERLRRRATEDPQFRGFRLVPLVKVDCGKFAGSMSHGVIELLGAPPSYVGWGHPPILTPLQFPPGIVRVLLFDELEKAFLDSRDQGAEMTGVLMSLLDEARIQNNRGEEVDFTWTVVIATSNFAAKDIIAAAKKRRVGFRPNEQQNGNGVVHLTSKIVERLNEEIYQKIRNALYDPQQSPFKPELLNRFDRIVVFRFLTLKEYSAILDKKIAALNDHLARSDGILLRLSPEAKQWILGNGIDFEYGVRSLERFLRRKIIDNLSRLLLKGELEPGDVIELRYSGGEELEFWKDPKPSLPDNSLALPTPTTPPSQSSETKSD